MRKWSVITVIGSGLVVGLLIFLSHQDSRPRDVGAGGDSDGTAPAPAVAGATAVPSGTAGDGAAATEAAAGLGNATTQAPRIWEGGPWRAGVHAFDSGDYVTARAALEAAVQERDTVPYRHYLLGLTCLRLGEPQAAARELEVAREQAPDNVRVLVNLARANVALQDLPAARAALVHALELDPQNADVHLVSGRVSLEEGDAEVAATAFARAAELAPELAWAWNNLGYARIQQERFADAVEPLRTATHLRDDVGVFFNNLGVALERTGDLVGAHLAYARAGELGHEAAVASGNRVDGLLVAQGLDPAHLPAPTVLDPVASQSGDTLAVPSDVTTVSRQ